MKYGLYTLLIESHFKNISMYPGLEFGWGNGYILIPNDHPFYGINCNEIYNISDISIHGGLTFSSEFDSDNFLKWVNAREIDGDITLDNYIKFNNYWIIGFDTNHYNDNSSNCTKEYVLSETLSLFEQCLCDSINSIKKYKTKINRLNKLNNIKNI